MIQKDSERKHILMFQSLLHFASLIYSGNVKSRVRLFNRSFTAESHPTQMQRKNIPADGLTAFERRYRENKIKKIQSRFRRSEKLKRSSKAKAAEARWKRALNATVRMKEGRVKKSPVEKQKGSIRAKIQYFNQRKKEKSKSEQKVGIDGTYKVIFGFRLLYLVGVTSCEQIDAIFVCMYACSCLSDQDPREARHRKL